MGNGVDIWQKYSSFQSTSYTQKYLKRNYDHLKIAESEAKSYANCYSFIYYIEHGRKYYQLAEQAATELKPILLFYGMIQLVKACILTVDPFYPESTSVLAHGVSTRKRKKQNYMFLQDEVKLQKNGLLNHLALQLFHVEHLPFERIKMEKLLARIPELNETFQHLKGNSPLMQVTFYDGKLAIPLSILDDLKMTERRFKHFLQTQTNHVITSFQIDSNIFIVTFHSALTQWDCTPFAFHQDGELLLPTNKELYKPIHEVIVHYLLLYNLSMICRYETEWWNELFHTFASNDLPFIHRFLTVTTKKIPFLLYLYLDKKRK